MRLTKRYLALFMAVALILGLAPSTMQAEGAVVSVINSTATEDTIEMENGLKQGMVYDQYANITVLEDMGYSEEANPVEVEDLEYTGYVQGTSNPKPDKGEIPTAGAALKAAPVREGELTLVFKLGDNKDYYVVCSDGTTIDKIENRTGKSQYYNKTYELSEGKEYYFYATGSKLSIYDVSYEKSSVSTLNLTDGLKAGVSYGHEGGISVLEDFKYGNPPATVIDGKEYTECVDGASNPAVSEGTLIPTSGAALKAAPERTGELTIVFRVPKNKVYYAVKGDGTVIETIESGDTDLFFSKTYEVEAGEEYYFYLKGSKIRMYEIYYDAVNIKNEVNLTEGLQKGQDYYGVSALNDLAYSESSQVIEGVTYDGYVTSGENPKLDENGIPVSGTVIKVVPVEDGKVEMAFKVNAGKTYFFIDGEGTVIETFENTESSSAYFYRSYDIQVGKEYYVYTPGSKMSFYGLSITKGTAKEKKDQIPWDLVEAPVIKKVSVDADGNFVINFEAVIDEYEGAECVRITMLENGTEVETKTFKTPEDTVVMTPLWSGNYSFVATAQRAGSPNKQSKTVYHNQYILSLPKPVITGIQNRGNAVYIDWMNLEDAESYTVEYKQSNESGYTLAADSVQDGHYLLEGLNAVEYDFRITAFPKGEGQASVYEASKAVTESAEDDWYVAIVGSAQEVNAVFTEADGTATNYNLSSKDNSAKNNVEAAVSIANTSGTAAFEGAPNGKISDDEEGFMYYYTVIDPNTENFELSATFTITDLSLSPDNQTGFGLIATDLLGINYYGEADYYHKYFNSVSNLFYSNNKKFMGFRAITGYESVDTSNNDDVVRETDALQYQNTQGAFEVGNAYTYKLSKTDDAFVAECNGEVLEYPNTSVLSVQDDGSICVGVMVSRKVSVDITDITFVKSESTGITGGSKDDTVTPRVTIYSSETSGSNEYEYIYHTNINGRLTVLASSGDVVYDQDVYANDVIRVRVPLTAGVNTISSELIPAAGQNITSEDVLYKTTTVTHKSYGIEEETIVVSPDGNEQGSGTYERPLDIHTAVKYVQPGQTILLKNGIYEGSTVVIGRSVSGTKNHPITMVAEDVGEVIFDGMGLNVIGSYWHIYGIEVKNSPTVGIQVCGNYNTIEMCKIQGSLNTGLQISRSGSAENDIGIGEMLWPSYNLIKNCESYDNCDVGRNDADGFAAKLTSGKGNVFYGCISHHNIDDGWDLYAKSISGEIGKVVIENCVAYSNGWLSTDDTKEEGYTYGEGNGFKLGGGYLKGGHELRNSIAFNNGAKGITSNSCPDAQVILCTSYHNSVIPNEESYNVGLNTKTSFVKEWVVEGLISMAEPSSTKLEDLIPFSLLNKANYFYNGKTSYNSAGRVASDDWFVSINVSKEPTRNDNGTINMNGLLEPTFFAPAGSGARLDVTSEKAISVKPEITDVVGTNVFVESVMELDQTSIQAENGTARADLIMQDLGYVSAGKHMNVSSVIPKEEVLVLVQGLDADVATVELTIHLLTNTSKNHTVSYDQLVLPADAYEAVVNAGRNFKINIQSGDNIVYVWNFETKTDHASEMFVSDVNLCMDLVDAKYGMYIDFAHQGYLPSIAKVSFAVDSKIFDEKTDVYMYLVDSETGAYATMPVTRYTINQDGFVSFNVFNCTEYVVLPEEVNENTVLELTEQVDVDVNQIVLSVGETKELGVQVPVMMQVVTSLTSDFNARRHEALVLYSAGNNKVVSVSEDGVVTALSKGETVINVTVQLGITGRVSYEIPVQVK